MAESSSKGFKTLEKGQIARYEQFLPFTVFSKRLILQTHKNQGLFGKGVILSNNKMNLKWCLDIVENLQIAKGFHPCKPVQTAQADMGGKPHRTPSESFPKQHSLDSSKK